MGDLGVVGDIVHYGHIFYKTLQSGLPFAILHNSDHRISPMSLIK